MAVSIGILFSVLYLVAALTNHIDDTDETYGYYEPVHYLLYGDGMQTWEYSPHYCIRSYAFLLPFAAVGALLKSAGCSKLTVFFGIRLFLGQVNAFTVAYFIRSAKEIFGEDRCRYLVLVLFCCPGLYFCSTALLPSAVACSLVLAGFASYFSGKYGFTIFYGCLAVLWSGWPFVGLVFLPLGLFILWNVITSRGFRGVLRIVAVGVFHLVAVSGAVVLADSFFYGKRTFPPLNILLYNAISGNGDELYGVEPTSYYIKNLLLTVGLSFPLALFHVLQCFGKSFYFSVFRRDGLKVGGLGAEIGVCLSAGLWVGLLFSRPHKEERFMYPIYPLLCLMSALALVNIEDGLCFMISGLTAFEKKKKAETEKNGLKRVFKGLVSMLFILISGCRIAALYNNYSGYFKLWYAVPDQIELDRISGALCSDLSCSDRAGENAVRVCMGSDWYTFPSHFFLPSYARLEYISDGFGGILPQHFSAILGTSAEPPQPFNDQNKEEISRYVSLSKCDYLVRLVRTTEDPLLVVANEGIRVQTLASMPIIDPNHSPLLTRAFFIPGIIRLLSGLQNMYNSYTLYKISSVE